MNRNITILVVILIILLIAGYLIWLRNKFQTVRTPVVVPTPTAVMATPIPTVIEATPSAMATPSGVKVSPTVKPKISPTLTPKPTSRVTPS